MATPHKLLTGADVNNQPIVNVPSPTNPGDAANKAYVDGLLQGLAWKQPVKAATTAAATLSTAFASGASLDGVTLATGDRILVKNQATGSENGIYVVTAGTPTRTTDADSAAELNSATVLVMMGTANADKTFTQTADNITIGTTALVWVQAGGGNTYTAGNGLALSGTAFAVNPGTGIIADGTSTRIDPAYTGLAKRYTVSLPAGATATAVTHNLGSSFPVVELFDTTGSVPVLIDGDIQITSANVVTVNTPSAVVANTLTVTVLA